jgi:cysteinyl-tRNA synthetase
MFPSRIFPRAIAAALPFLLTLVLFADAEESGGATPPKSFGYVLQADSLASPKAAAIQRLATSGRDWVVLDAAYATGSPWTRTDLDAIRAGRPGRKLICYLSIGEAEDYRPYWRSDWVNDHKPTAVAPPWLVAVNPGWAGNYKVKYWHADWQKIMLPAVDAVMAAGFDGLYLDIIDGFEFFEQDGKNYIDDRPNPETKQTFRRDMVDWVKAIATRARKTNPAAIIIPQNGAQLLAHADYIAAIDAIGIEDLFSNGKKLQPKSHTGEILQSLKPMAGKKKPVLDVEYPEKPEHGALVEKEAHTNGYIWLRTDRELKTLGVSGN